MGFAIHDCYTNIIPILFETLPWRSNSKAGEAFQMHQGLGKCMAGGAVRCAMCILFFAWDNFQNCWGPTDLLLAEVYHKYKSQIATKFDWYYNHIYICIYIILYMIFTIENWHIPFVDKKNCFPTWVIPPLAPQVRVPFVIYRTSIIVHIQHTIVMYCIYKKYLNHIYIYIYIYLYIYKYISLYIYIYLYIDLPILYQPNYINPRKFDWLNRQACHGLIEALQELHNAQRNMLELTLGKDHHPIWVV